MVEQRKKQKTKRRDKNRGLMNEVTKEEYAVAKYVRFNCPTKTATILGNEMHYFTASKAIDCLMASKKWSGSEKNDDKPKLFTNRQSCVIYMQTLLDKGLLFRAKKLVPKRKDSETLLETTPAAATAADKSAILRKDSIKSKNLNEEVKEKEKHEKTPKSTKKLEKSKKSSGETASVTNPAESNDKETGNKKKSKKIKFEVHQIQEFNDSNDIYVWKYDPTSTKMFCLGLAMVLGSIGVCLFPLWPPEVRLGVYYLSVAAMIFVGLIVILVVLRCVLFALVWLVTFGKHHFWLLPHLTDDCGFFDSFKPLYSHNMMGKDADESGKKDSAGTGKDGSNCGSTGIGKDGTSTGSADLEKPDDEDDNSGAEQDDKNSEDEENYDGKQNFSESEQFSDEEESENSNADSVNTGTEEDMRKYKKDN